jgi:hypothetical protein
MAGPEPVKEVMPMKMDGRERPMDTGERPVNIKMK